MKHCPRANTPTGIGVNPVTGIAIVSKMGCKSWACPYCSLKRKGWLVVKAYMGIEAYKAQGVANWYFGTLTMHRKWRGAASVVNFKKNWNKFYQRLKRNTDGPLYYILLPERHKDGSLHVHIISTCGAPSRFWKDAGAKCGMGFQNQNEPLNSTVKAAFYVTKYIGKAVGLANWPADLRRVRFSVRWPKPLQNAPISWQCVPPDMAKHAVRKRLAMGYKIVNAMTGEVVNVKAHEFNARARRLSNSGVSTQNKLILESVGTPPEGVDTAQNEKHSQFQQRWNKDTGIGYWL